MTVSSLNILLLYDCIYPESLGGVEHRNYHLARSLAQLNHRVTLAGWCNGVQNLFPGVQVLPLSFRTNLYNKAGKRSVWTSLKFAAATLSLPIQNFDVIETANIPYLHLFPLAVRCAIAGKPLVITWYEYWGNYWKDYVGVLASPFFMGIEWLCGQLGKKVNACSFLTAERLQAHRLGTKKVSIIPCGVSLKEIREASKNTKRARPLLVYAGRLMREKRIDILLEAMARIPLQQDKATLTIIGDGPDRQRLQLLAEQLGISQKVEFLGRLPTNNDVWNQIARARIAVQPSSREGFGLFPLESMAVGTPVVYCESSENAIAGLVRDGIEGICTHPDPVSLASGIERLLDDTEFWTRLSENAKKRAKSYDWANIAQQIEVLFYRAIQ